MTCYFAAWLGRFSYNDPHIVCCTLLIEAAMASPTGKSPGFATGGGSREILDCPELSPIVNGISFAGKPCQESTKSELGEWGCTPFERRETFSLSF
jgi:hypothetical protein